MKAFLDTNIILDVLMESRENNLDSSTVLKVAKAGYLDVVISTQSILDSYYVAVDVYGTPLKEFKAALKEIMKVTEVKHIAENEIEAAMVSENKDFEDAAQIACAISSGCDFIISSDKKMKRDSSLKVSTPTELCNQIFGQWE